MRGRVDEVGEGDQRGGEADGGAVERGDEDFRVRVEGVRDFEVVGREGAEPVLAGVGGGGGGAREGYVGAAGRGDQVCGQKGEGEEDGWGTHAEK